MANVRDIAARGGHWMGYKSFWASNRNGFARQQNSFTDENKPV